jgi:hypothetical protein
VRFWSLESKHHRYSCWTSGAPIGWPVLLSNKSNRLPPWVEVAAGFNHASVTESAFAALWAAGALDKERNRHLALIGATQ